MQIISSINKYGISKFLLVTLITILVVICIFEFSINKDIKNNFLNNKISKSELSDQVKNNLTPSQANILLSDLSQYNCDESKFMHDSELNIVGYLSWLDDNRFNIENINKVPDQKLNYINMERDSDINLFRVRIDRLEKLSDKDDIFNKLQTILNKPKEQRKVTIHANLGISEIFTNGCTIAYNIYINKLSDIEIAQ